MIELDIGWSKLINNAPTGPFADFVTITKKLFQNFCTLILRVRNFLLEAQNFHSISGLVIGQSVLREVSLGTISFYIVIDHVTVIAAKVVNFLHYFTPV